MIKSYVMTLACMLVGNVTAALLTGDWHTAVIIACGEFIVIVVAWLIFRKDTP